MSSIAVFDSGMGGLTVLSELIRLMPGENYIYYGDSANAPYGDRTAGELLELTTRVCRRIRQVDDIKCYVTACNTTTSDALDKLEKRFPETPFAGIEPALRRAVSEEPGRNILILATTVTINGRRLAGRIAELKDRANIIPLAAPGIVPYVESPDKDEEGFMRYLEELLSPYRRDTDCVVLGCTHFPFVRREISLCMDKQVRFYDAAPEVADNVYRLLLGRGMLEPQGSPGHIIFLNSDESKTAMEARLLDEYRGLR